MKTGRFAGKVALITGGSRGIGAEIARRLAREGARVTVGYRGNRVAAEAVQAEIAALGAEARIAAADVADPVAAQALVESAHAAHGRLDILVHAAGIAPYLPLERCDAAHYRTVFDTNVLSTLTLTRAAAPLLTAPGGRVVHLSSRLVWAPIPGSAVYAASKAAVTALTLALAKELGPRGITINAVAPGVIETDMTEAIVAERGEAIRAMTPLGRIGKPEDVAGVVAFLASEDAGWITGRTIRADGGMA
ncbi:MAG: dehydrogenase [Alphaproteobacteria bacterium HGW-Alphaproteobacteria-2]|nr:MAG: dehydrogenase [Alphaproteobacteria bacterium HGW-Alphaproteobacteria-2]